MTSKEWFKQVSKLIDQALETGNGKDKALIGLLVELRHMMDSLRIILGLPRLGLEEVGDELALLAKKINKDALSMSKKELRRLVEILGSLTPEQFWLWVYLYGIKTTPKGLMTDILIAWKTLNMPKKDLPKLQLLAYTMQRVNEVRELLTPPPKAQ